MTTGLVVDSLGKCRVCIWFVVMHGITYQAAIALKTLLGNACARRTDSVIYKHMKKAWEISSSIPKVDGSKFAEMQSRAFTQYLRKIAQHDCNQP